MTYPCAVLHDGAVVVLDEIVCVDLLELRLIRRIHVVPVNLDPVIPVASHLFVPHAESVSDLVHWDAKLQNTRQRRLIIVLASQFHRLTIK